jgi:hypothetical protein
MKITAFTILQASCDALRAVNGPNDRHYVAACEARDGLARLIEWSEQALECISASKYPNTHAELRSAIASIKDGAA